MASRTDTTEPTSPAPKRRKRGRPRRSDGVATRTRILEGARDLFAASGYEATSLRHIASVVGIDVATVKYHFADKAALFAEVYTAGHNAMLVAIAPILGRLEQLRTNSELLRWIRDLIVVVHDFLEQRPTFVRMALFRFLERADAQISFEDELQSQMTGLFDQTIQGLIDRGLVRPIDVRSLSTMLIGAFSTWFVIADARPAWLNDRDADWPARRARSEAFYTDVLERLLVGSQR